MALSRRRPDRGLIHHSDQGCPVHGGAVHHTLREGRDRGLDRLGRRLLSQRRLRDLPRQPQEGADLPAILADPSRGTHCDLRVRRGLVQPTAPALHAGLPLSNRVRTTTHRARPTSARDLGGRVDRAEGLRRAYHASRLGGRRRFGSSLRRTPTLFQPVPLRPRHGQSRDERPRVASPLCSHRTSSLIQTSTTTAKTCRPNRGRSNPGNGAGLLPLLKSRSVIETAGT